MSIQNNSKTNSILDKLGFGWVKTVAVLVVVGMGLSCDSDIATPDTIPDFFTISYPRMASEFSNVSVPVIVSGKNCDLRSLTDAGSATYSIVANTVGETPPTPPTIEATTGVVKNNGAPPGIFPGNSTGASPGTYRVRVVVPGNIDCNTNVLVYNTITPAYRLDLKNHLVRDNSGIALHGDNGDYNYIDTSQVRSFYQLFQGKSTFNGDISEWETSNAANMIEMFDDASEFNGDISKWDTSKVENMNRMFDDASKFNGDISKWDTSQVRFMSFMFNGASAFNQDISGWDTSKVEDMWGMFKYATAFNQPIGEWKTSNVIDMSSMFSGASEFNQDISGWDTSRVKYMAEMFKNASKFDQDLSGWDVANVFPGSDIFAGSAMENKTHWYPEWRPAPPENLTHETVASTSVTLKWDMVAEAKSYVIYQGSNAIFTNTGDSPATTYTVNGLTAGSEYTFSVTVCTDDDTAFCSVRIPYQVTTVPPTPTGLTHSDVTSASVVLSLDQVPGADEYVVYNGEKPIATNIATSFTVFYLNHKADYTFTVRACNAFGCSGDSTSVTFTTLSLPDFFTIRYPNMASETPVTRRPAIASGKNCDLQALTAAGSATYEINAKTAGTTPLTLPTIDTKTGVVKNDGASPGIYRVVVTVDGKSECSADVLIYNTITPTYRFELEDAIDSGIGFHGDNGDYNYIITSKMTSFFRLFYARYTFNGDISKWDTSQVHEMSQVFSHAYEFNQPLSGWDTSKVRDMSGIFFRADKFNQDLSGWDTSGVQDMSYMFLDASEFNQDISGWETSNVTDMAVMFEGASAFNQPLSNWDTSKVENMRQMFYSALAFNQPLSNWDTSQVINMSNMFHNAKAFDQDLSGWKVDKVTNYDGVFTGSAMEGKPEKHPAWTP